MAQEGVSGATLLVVAATPRSTPLAVRDRLAIAEAESAAVLDDLRRADVAEAVVIATCERTEVYALTAVPAASANAIVGVLAAQGGLDAGELAAQLKVIDGEGAVRHLFMLAASLDSLVVGEPNILGQIKAGRRLARAAGMVGSGLDSYLQAAFAAAKRVRSQTSLGTGPASLAAAAVDVARSVHGELERCRVLLVGSGEMADLVTHGLIGAGLLQVVATDPLAARAERAAQTLDGHIVAFETLAAALCDADIVVTGLGSRRFLLSPATVREALRRRRHRPMVLIDCAIPGDVDPGVDGIEEAFRYDLDDLERLARDGHASRRQDIERARALVEADVRAFTSGLRERDAVGAVIALRRCFEEARDAALADAGGDAERATRLLINRLLHGPTETLKGIARSGGAASGDLDQLQRCLSRLFKLELGDTENDE
jgi:glutamyl-tRNA reductase